MAHDARRQSDAAVEFDDWVALLDYPMFIVTTVAAGQRAGCLVGFASQTSISPPRFLIGLSRRNHTFAVAQRADYLAVHVLARADRALAQLFGSETGDSTDKFARCSWHSGPEGLPILDQAAGWFVGKIRSRHDLGDHCGHLVEPIAASVAERSCDIITFADVRDLQPGHDA